jgi:CxxC motif-containing protein (DUF1111 family)
MKKNTSSVYYDLARNINMGKYIFKVAVSSVVFSGMMGSVSFAADAPAGFDENTNGYLSQAQFNQALNQFKKVETIPDGLGPVFNNDSCGACHNVPVTGGSGPARGLRAGYFDGTNFIDPPGGSLIDARAIDPSIIPHIPSPVAGESEVQTFRLTLNAWGDGFVEAIADQTLIAIAQAQPQQSNNQIQGEYVMVDILEAPGAQGVGRFGWKDQHASLVSFSGDASRNEIGITNPLFPTELTSNGNSVAAFETVANPNVPTIDSLVTLANFIRSTKVPPQGAPGPNNGRPGPHPNGPPPLSPSVLQGEQLFAGTGCNICHVASITTAPAGTLINGGTYQIPAALGNLTIHPYGDFLLHNIGTGDGIVQNGGQSTREKVRTSALWGLHARHAYLHDGSVTTLQAAIAKHSGEASSVINNYNQLSAANQQNLLNFLQSL